MTAAPEMAQHIATDIVLAVGELVRADLALRQASLAALSRGGSPAARLDPVLFIRSANIKLSYMIIEREGKRILELFRQSTHERIAGFRLSLTLAAALHGASGEIERRVLVYHPPAFIRFADEGALVIDLDGGGILEIRVLEDGKPRYALDGAEAIDVLDARLLVRLLRTIAAWSATAATAAPRRLSEEVGLPSGLRALLVLMLGGCDDICRSVALTSAKVGGATPIVATRTDHPVTVIQNLWRELADAASTLRDRHCDLVGGFAVDSIVGRLLVDLQKDGELASEGAGGDSGRGQQVDIEITYSAAETGHQLHAHLRIPDILTSQSQLYVQFLGSLLNRLTAEEDQDEHCSNILGGDDEEERATFATFISEVRNNKRNVVVRIFADRAVRRDERRDVKEDINLFLLQAQGAGRIDWVLYRARVTTTLYPEVKITSIDKLAWLAKKVDGQALINNGEQPGDKIGAFVARLVGILARWHLASC